MDQWKGAPKPTTPATSGSCTAKPAQSQPASTSKQTSTTTKKPTSKKRRGKSANSYLLSDLSECNRKAGAFDDAPACLSHFYDLEPEPGELVGADSLGAPEFSGRLCEVVRGVTSTTALLRLP
jgi:hypothetical protein